MDLTHDHKVLEGAQATRRYFAKFARINEHLKEVTKLSKKEKLITTPEATILQWYLEGLSTTFTALSYKYLMANRVGDHSETLLNIDKRDSGFPVFSETLQMAADALQAKEHLKSLPSQERLKKDMINHILTERSAPTKLQYAMSQRIYYEYLNSEKLFLSQNDPQVIWTGSQKRGQRRKYLIYWAKYDSESNVPQVYLMEIQDSGKKALPKDERRWPRVQSHLMAQSMSSLKLLTIARGFDRDFPNLHPKMLRRFHIGPMYSHKFTEQHGPLRDVLADAAGEPGLDWALTWTIESLVSQKTTSEKTGFFSSAEREVYAIDKRDLEAQDKGVSDIRRSLILPHRAYQVLEEKNHPSLRGIRKYVVGNNSRILSY
ncbi:MAG: hypothetical protein EX271_12115 [Acidimicrobiales bacterium]|nr:hypothetical protein [Hyphomonadaceae bacterium]RZV36567.1 MAG: hypothetical protein EX271_12115 [Acidimicrobiales bacterium]